jgi:hypothetical protein
MTTTPQPPSRYGEFTQQYFAGAWRGGRSLTHAVVDTNPLRWERLDPDSLSFNAGRRRRLRQRDEGSALMG